MIEIDNEVNGFRLGIEIWSGKASSGETEKNYPILVIGTMDQTKNDDGGDDDDDDDDDKTLHVLNAYY